MTSADNNTITYQQFWDTWRMENLKNYLEVTFSTLMSVDSWVKLSVKFSSKTFTHTNEQ